MVNNEKVIGVELENFKHEIDNKNKNVRPLRRVNWKLYERYAADITFH